MSAASTSCSNTHIKYFFVNGMAMQEDSIQKSLKSHEKRANINIELHFNNTTPPERVAQIGICSLLAIADAAPVLNPNIDKEQKARHIEDLTSQIFKICEGWGGIQEAKKIEAELLAQKISNYFKESGPAHVRLILYSQGADIGKQALERLSTFKDKISVVSLGGMVNINKHLASKVVNFHFHHDFVSGIANGLYDPLSRIINQDWNPFKPADIRYLDSNPLMVIQNHGLSSYLLNPQVHQEILQRPV